MASVDCFHLKGEKIEFCGNSTCNGDVATHYFLEAKDPITSVIPKDSS